MYPQIFSAAKEVDQAFLIILGFSVLILVLVTAFMLFFLWKYNYKRNPKAADIEGSVWVEIVWTVLPTLIVLGLFWTGWSSFKAMRTIPEGSMEVKVEGRMWSWLFVYENGRKSANLVVPVNTPVKLVLDSKDVIHSFYIPAMRLKWDMVPGMETKAWLQSNSTGEWDIFCAEYCGLKHADMLALLQVVSAEEFDVWLNEQPVDGNRAQALMEEYGCLSCHSFDGSEDAAPTLKDIAMRERMVVLPNGSKVSVVADSEYLHKAILKPGAELVDGWDDEMPPYGDEMTKEDVDIIVEFLLKGVRVEHPGKMVAEEQGCLSCHATDSSEDVGPGFGGLYGSLRQYVAADGKEMAAKVDENYIKESIVAPSVKIAVGFEDGMPPYEDLTPDEMALLIDYIRSLAGNK